MPEVSDAGIGANVRALRESVELSQSAVAQRMQESGFPHWRQSTVGKTESGERPLKFTEALVLAVIVGARGPFLGHSVAGLIGDVSDCVKENRIRLAEQRLAEAKQS